MDDRCPYVYVVPDLDLVVVTTAAAGAGPPVSPPVSAAALPLAAFASALDGNESNLVMADRGQPEAAVANETTTKLPGPAPTGEMPTTLAPQTTRLPPVPTTRQATPTVPTVAPPTTVDAEPSPRPLPVITVANEYTVEVYGFLRRGYPPDVWLDPSNRRARCHQYGRAPPTTRRHGSATSAASA